MGLIHSPARCRLDFESTPDLGLQESGQGALIPGAVRLIPQADSNQGPYALEANALRSELSRRLWSLGALQKWQQNFLHEKLFNIY